jgi:hypothetical protein
LVFLVAGLRAFSQLFATSLSNENVDIQVTTTISWTPCKVGSALTLLGLTGFDMSSGGRACDPICSESLNGAKNRIANQQFALAA